MAAQKTKNINFEIMNKIVYLRVVVELIYIGVKESTGATCKTKYSKIYFNLKKTFLKSKWRTF